MLHASRFSLNAIMKCLVTGGAGFIGSHLCDRLIVEGHDVVCVDNLITGNEENITQLKTNPHFSFVKFDCSNPLPNQFDVNLIFHLASPASPPKYQQYPIETLLVNTIGTHHLLDLAKKQGSIFVYASTSEVYGDPEEHPQKETYWGHVNPTGERACYDEGKRAGEAFVMTYVRKFGVDGRIIRIFNTYGPRMDIDDGRVITNFIKQIINDKPLTINGDGQQTRSFCYVSDLVEGIVQVAKTPALQGEVINLGNPEELTILELVSLIKDISHYNGEVAYKDLPSDDPVRRRPDISRAKDRLGWEPHISLRKGLLKTLKFYQEHV